jgi:hypothetical protein
MKIRPVGTDLYQADRRTDMTTIIVACHNSAKQPKKAVEEKGHNMQDFNNTGWRNLMLSMRFILNTLTEIERCPINVELGYLVQVHI